MTLTQAEIDGVARAIHALEMRHEEDHRRYGLAPDQVHYEQQTDHPVCGWCGYCEGGCERKS